jgi:hypothetical protein
MRRLLAAAICAALALGGCGGASSDSPSTASAPSSTAQDTSAPSVPQPSRRSAAGQAKGKARQPDGSAAKGKTASSSTHSAAMVKVPPISSAPVAGSKAPAPGVKTVKGGDDSVQTYGVEADSSARTEAAIALQAYLDDRLGEDWQGACSLLAQKPKEQLGKFEEQLQSQGKGTSGCAAVLAALGEGTPQSQLQEEATIEEVLSFRGQGDIAGDPSYLIFTGPPGSTLYSMPMYFEAGGWKVGLAQPSELPV